MTEFDYHVIALIPPEPPFDLERVIQTLNSEGFKAHRVEGKDAGGIRVVEGDGWGIVAWMDADDEARGMNKELSESELPAGATSAQIACCPAQLIIWSDDDSDLMNAHVFEDYIQFLKTRFGFFIFDNRLGEWR